jgi:hypothetical protein
LASRSSRSNRSRDWSRSSARNRRVGVAGPSRTQIAHPSRSRPHTNVRPVTWSSSSGASTSPSLGGDSGSPLTVRLTHDDHHRHCSVYPPVARRYCDSRRRANWPSRHCRRPVRLPDSLAPGEPPYLRARLWAPMPQLLRSRDPIRPDAEPTMDRAARHAALPMGPRSLAAAIYPFLVVPNVIFRRPTGRAKVIRPPVSSSMNSLSSRAHLRWARQVLNLRPLACESEAHAIPLPVDIGEVQVRGCAYRALLAPSRLIREQRGSKMVS